MARRSWGAVRKLPSGRYQAKYRLEGVLTPAPETFPNRAQADRWLTNQRMEMERGENVDEKLGSRALGSWWPGYERSIARLRATTCNGYRAAWRLRIGPAFGSTAVRKIKATDVDEWLLRLREDGTSNGKIAEAYGVLNRLLDRAVRDKAIYRNPCRQRMEKLSRPKAIQRPVLTPIQVEQLVAPMATDLDRVCVRLMAYGGLRIGEMLGLHWDDVDFDRGTLTIRRSINDNSGKLVVELPKNGIVRTITLGETMTDQLRALKGTGKVYPSSRGGYRRYRNWRRDTFDRAAKTAKLVVLPHDLRGTAASLLIDAGASVKDVQLHLGHADELTTLRLYTRVRPGRSADIAKKLDALIAETA